MPDLPLFDCRPSLDPRNNRYLLADHAPTNVARVQRMWTPGPLTNQGREGACVGHGWTTELTALPAPVELDQPDNYASALYHAAQQIDEWDGDNYSGTSVLAGAKVVQSRGYIDSYLWVHNVSDLIDAIIQFGPVVLSVSWLDGMYHTRPSGLVEVNGNKVGGHCITATGYGPRYRLSGETFVYHEVIRWRNSWGPNYGRNGDGYLHLDDVQTLFDQGAEGCVPVGRHTDWSIRGKV